MVRELDDHYTQIVRRVVGHGIVQQALGGFLWTFGNIADDVDSGLVFADIPKLYLSAMLGVDISSVEPNKIRIGSSRQPIQAKGRLTPSQATMRNSSFSSKAVSVVYGEPTTNSLTLASPRERVTARTPGEISGHSGVIGESVAFTAHHSH